MSGKENEGKTKSILLVHVYVVNNWKEISKGLIEKSQHSAIAIHVSFDLRYIFLLPWVYFFFKKLDPRINWIFISSNRSRKSEVVGLEKFRKKVDVSQYDLFTYVHTKGVSKPQNKFVIDWRKLMEYFILERLDLTIKAFEKGFSLYGVNLLEEKTDPHNINRYAFVHTDYIFRGNFVSVNLNQVGKEFLGQPIGQDYYGLEGFWGNLAPIEKAYCVHESGVSHYKVPYPETNYRDLEIEI